MRVYNVLRRTGKTRFVDVALVGYLEAALLLFELWQVLWVDLLNVCRENLSFINAKIRIACIDLRLSVVLDVT